MYRRNKNTDYRIRCELSFQVVPIYRIREHVTFYASKRRSNGMLTVCDFTSSHQREDHYFGTVARYANSYTYKLQAALRNAPMRPSQFLGSSSDNQTRILLVIEVIT